MQATCASLRELRDKGLALVLRICGLIAPCSRSGSCPKFAQILRPRSICPGQHARLRGRVQQVSACQSALHCSEQVFAESKHGRRLPRCASTATMFESCVSMSTAWMRSGPRQHQGRTGAFCKIDSIAAWAPGAIRPLWRRSSRLELRTTAAPGIQHPLPLRSIEAVTTSRVQLS